MCGIAAIVNVQSGKPLRDVQEILHSMVQVMKYRGPNARGVFVDEQLGGMGHARLSIISVDESSNQPFHSSTKNCCISFNGEIYNYLELRKELETEFGFKFRTNSDTEVLLAAYEIWGDECVQRFNGMWAFVIFDFKRRRVFCSRDRFGVKPFLYAQTGNNLYIGSEAKAILIADDRFRKPNYKALSLLLRASIGGQNLETCFEGISRLPPAHNLVVENGQIGIKRYWDFPRLGQNAREISLEEASEELGHLLRDAIRLRLRSDVPVGFTLSGGLDSSAIVALAGEIGFSGLKAYTATYRHDHYVPDESAMARTIAKSTGMELIPVELLASDLLPLMTRSNFHLEAPHAAMPILPYWKIMERAKEDVTVLLEGQGADELLGGYTSALVWPAVKDCLRSVRIRDAFQFMHHGLRGHYGSSGLSFLLMMCRTQLDIPGLHTLFRTARGDESVYQGPLRSETSDRLRVRKQRSSGDHVNDTLQLQHENGLVNLLQYGDAIPMAHSIEGRLPFMDYRLVEFVCRLPGRFKLRHGYSKYLLRESMKNILPTSLTTDRYKRGFDTPVGKWFEEQSDEIVKPVLLSKACRDRGLFDLDRIQSLMKSHQSGRVDFTSQIYRWTVTELWFQQFMDKRQEVEDAQPGTQLSYGLSGNSKIIG